MVSQLSFKKFLFAACSSREEGGARLFVAILLSVLFHISALVAQRLFPVNFLPEAGGAERVWVSFRATPSSEDELAGKSVASEVVPEDRRLAEVLDAEQLEPILRGGLVASEGGAGVGGEEVVVAEPILDYHPVNQLSVRPLPLSELESPDFELPMQVQHASVVIDVFISEFGEVVATKLVESELPLVYTEALVVAFGRLRFKPGEIDGLPVASLLRVELTAENLGLAVQ